MDPAVPWILNLCVAGVLWSITMMIVKEHVFHRSEDEVHVYWISALSLGGVFLLVYLWHDNPSEEVSYYSIPIGVVLGLVSAFGVFGGKPPADPRSDEPGD